MKNNVIDNIKKGFVGPSKIHGFGLFASENIKCSETIASLDGQVVPWEYIKIQFEGSEWNAIDLERVLFRPFKTKYFFINHSRVPNLKIVQNSCWKLQIITTKEVAGGDELLLDYRMEPLPEWYVNGHGATYL